MVKLQEYFQNDKEKVKANGYLNFYKKVNNFYEPNKELFEEIGYHFKKPTTYLFENVFRFPYTKVDFKMRNIGLNFVKNKDEPVHRWTSYLEGFSKEFVYHIIQKFKLTPNNTILDPFAGSGTVNVCAKVLGIPSAGIEINPTVTRILKTKTDWSGDPDQIINVLKKMDFSKEPQIDPPAFLQNERQFQPQILKNILKIKEQISLIEDTNLKKYFELAFLTILLPSSNLKRSPSIGYDKKKTKNLYSDLPLELFRTTIVNIANDLKYMQRKNLSDTQCFVFNEDSKEFTLPTQHKIDAVITSPPYLNSFDYPGNYKLEIGWMDDAQSTTDLRILRDTMIVCDNVSRTMIKEYAKTEKVFDEIWFSYLITAVESRMKERIGIRRSDYPIIIRKYFEDIYKVLKNLYLVMNDGGKVAWVVGDSLILDVYIPTDLLTMVIAEKIGFKPLRVEIDRKRRSGIRRSFILRESVLYFKK